MTSKTVAIGCREGAHRQRRSDNGCFVNVRPWFIPTIGRGYQQDSLSGYELFGAPVGGSKLLVLNGEVRFPLFWLLSGAGFVDAGNTFTDEGGISLADMAVGAGFGLRIRTPLAPVRLDLGFPLSRWTGQTGARWHFSIGQIF